jgi:hypothetical protein
MKEAQLVSGATLSYAVGNGTSTAPAFTAMANMITSLPEFFSKPDTVDTTTVDNLTQTNIPALTGGNSLDFGILLNAATYAVHAALLAGQIDTEKGPSWFKLVFTAPLSRSVTWQGSVASNLTINSGGASDLMQGILAVYPSSNLTEAAVT